MSVIVYADCSIFDLFDVIDEWNNCKIETTVISLRDLTLMKNHIEDLELEVYGDYRDNKEEPCKQKQ